MSPRRRSCKARAWARARTGTGWRAELAGTETPADWETEARRLFALPDTEAQVVVDTARGTARIAFHDGDRLLAALFVSRQPVRVMRSHLAGLPGQDAPHVLTGRAPADQPDPGPIVCSCFNVGVNQILEAIETGGAISVDAVGTALQAGTNCGSCRPEIAVLLERTRAAEPAE